ncbi:MAG: SDR family oxidoreductase [Moraxellaceae bacterium]|jgi:short-subunit dehydrogenase|nr:SDR family oxidoreductase [Moraxellaceae bacterium]HQX89087.1 SDR family oxidoreductase [Moraxellaceae bacterium]
MSSSLTLATVITGASSGIGEALARQLAVTEKQTLVLVARREEKLLALAEELTKAHSIRIEIICQDLELPGGASSLMNAITARGLSVDTLINNAGFGINDPFADMPLDRIQGMMQLNMVALTELSHAVLPGMRQRQQGRIMNISSVAAFQACPRFAVYGASKAYVLMFTEALAAEERKNGLRISAVCPGATATEFHTLAGNHGTFAAKLMDSPETVTRSAIAALNAGQSVVVTGLLNKPLPFFIRLMPRRLATWFAGILVEREKAA